jgi:hypothetical protein
MRQLRPPSLAQLPRAASPSCSHRTLGPRTPFVETYLQNLKLDPQVGPVPVQDHYFLGRMDLGESVDRRDYLSKDSYESYLLGGFTKLFRFEYKPLGFAWMIYADRDDFNRQTYDFKYVHREFLGDVRCIVFDVSPKRAPARAASVAESG